MPKRPTDPDEQEAQTTYHYVGNGSFIAGIPARDLSAADVAAFDAVAIESIESSQLYEKVV